MARAARKHEDIEVCARCREERRSVRKNEGTQREIRNDDSTGAFAYSERGVASRRDFRWFAMHAEVFVIGTIEGRHGYLKHWKIRWWEGISRKNRAENCTNTVRKRFPAFHTFRLGSSCVSYFSPIILSHYSSSSSNCRISSRTAPSLKLQALSHDQASVAIFQFLSRIQTPILAIF